ncbi:MAG TPA: hypothetical protein VJ673_01620 [Aromatoleum sp.]|uniref:hypothetical protein n=1 Tax=Aromatoleum sp. TaxID=2307007 RepID=UPI002B484231|nr:hypothetical protein [Aromatoleum sp.]HJV24347.1 hypothetical protein [Aromatoleum sp.]
MRGADFSALDDAGLNLQAVFDIAALPADIRDKLRSRFDPEARYPQLILIGHAGRRMWEHVRATRGDSAHPVDEYSVATVQRWFADVFPDRDQRVIYPGDTVLDLLALGRLAGWHNPSPFMIGIQQDWGTWFAYRVVMLADSDLAPTPPLAAASPCASCLEQACVAACPGAAVSSDGFALDKCITYRCQPSSACRHTCLARVSCPVGVRHRYDADQLRHTYTLSLQAIEAYCRPERGGGAK